MHFFDQMLENSPPPLLVGSFLSAIDSFDVLIQQQSDIHAHTHCTRTLLPSIAIDNIIAILCTYVLNNVDFAL
jgi:Na+/citrate or Na+/malate symporter